MGKRHSVFRMQDPVWYRHPFREAAERIYDRLHPDERTMKRGRERTELGGGRQDAIRAP